MSFWFNGNPPERPAEIDDLEDAICGDVKRRSLANLVFAARTIRESYWRLVEKQKQVCQHAEYHHCREGEQLVTRCKSCGLQPRELAKKNGYE